ncbi:MAG: YbhB/YbcL family Raf kinase inhibitor-like protein [bacterium]
MKPELIMIALVPLFVIACTNQRANDSGQKSSGPAELTVKSSAFKQGEPIPKKYTQEGENASLPLSWSGAPEGVEGYAIIMDDPDAPTDKPYVHWVVYKIPPETTSLAEGDAGEAVEGRNSQGRPGYIGPMPPKGHGVHHYHIKVYALDEPVELYDNAGKNELLVSMEMDDRIVAKGELVGTYER